MADWEDEDFEPEPPKAPVTDQWSGEDEDEDVKDNWDDDEGEAGKPSDSAKAVEKPKKKPLAERIAEREEKKRLDAEKKRQEEELANKSKTAEELAAEKERRRLQEEEEQLMLAKELMGVKVEPTSGIDAMNPVTVEQFTEFVTALRKKITQFEHSPHYPKLLEDLFRETSASLNSDSIKKLGTTLNTLANEKQKIEKAKDGKKKKSTKAKLTVGRDNDYVLDDQGGYDEYDDFM